MPGPHADGLPQQALGIGLGNDVERGAAGWGPVLVEMAVGRRSVEVGHRVGNVPAAVGALGENYPLVAIGYGLLLLYVRRTEERWRPGRRGSRPAGDSP